MLPVHTILHPTDFSERSQHAFWLACSLARDYGARLIVLHVVPVPAVVYGEGVLPPNPEELLAAAREQLNRLPAPRADVRAERQLADGDAVEEILRIAREAGADLVVMGTHGRTGVGRLLMGSVAEQVVRRASCPVLTVKAPFPAPPRAGVGAAGEAASAAGGS
jgi:nucleotide-binding universal stress UspA family protein